MYDEDTTYLGVAESALKDIQKSMKKLYIKITMLKVLIQEAKEKGNLDMKEDDDQDTKI